MAAKARLSRWPGAWPASSLTPVASNLLREPTLRAVLCTDRVANLPRRLQTI